MSEAVDRAFAPAFAAVAEGRVPGAAIGIVRKNAVSATVNARAATVAAMIAAAKKNAAGRTANLDDEWNGRREAAVSLSCLTRCRDRPPPLSRPA